MSKSFGRIHNIIFALSALGTLCAFLVYVPVIYGAQFKRAQRDTSALYAVHATKSSTEPGKWNMRETIKLCPAPSGTVDERGTAIRYIAVSPSNPCPGTE